VNQPRGTGMLFTPDEARLGGATTGVIYNRDLGYCGSNHFDLTGQIRGSSWVGSLHYGGPNDHYYNYEYFSQGTFTLSPN